MGKFVQKTAKLYVAQFDLSGDLRKLGLSYDYDEVDETRYGNTCHSAIAGIPKVVLDAEGLFEADATSAATWKVDDVLWDTIEDASKLMTVCPVSGAVSETCFFSIFMEGGYSLGSPVGEIVAFNAKAVGQGQPLVRGTVMGTGAKTATGTGTAYELGAATAAKYLYAGLHVFSAAGTNPTLDVIIESDDAEAFGSATTRATFAQKTAASAQWLTPVAGPVTDTWWRAKWTIGGSANPTFNIAVVFGIL